MVTTGELPLVILDIEVLEVSMRVDEYWRQKSRNKMPYQDENLVFSLIVVAARSQKSI